MDDTIKEKGAAKITVELSKGRIIVTHGFDGVPLVSWVANKGDWERIWSTINTLKALGGE